MIIIDDHEIVRRGTADIVDRIEGFRVVAEAGSVASGTNRIDLVQPKIALIDLRLPDGSGLDIVRHINDKGYDIRSIILTSFDDRRAMHAAYQVGVSAFILKTVRGLDITKALQDVAQGRRLLTSDTLRQLGPEEELLASLTPSEYRLLAPIGKGMSNREIAAELGIAEKTVKNQMTSLLAKFGMQRRSQVVAWVTRQMRSGWQADG